MEKLISIRENDLLTPGFRCMVLLYFPTMAIVQFFFPYSSDFTTYLLISISIAVLLILATIVLFCLHYVFQYDVNANLYGKRLCLFGFYFGKWSTLTIDENTKYISFQKFSQTYETNFLNIYSSSTKEDVFVIRSVDAQGKYKTIVETTEFKSVPSCLILGNLLASRYNIPFNDYVKDMVIKERRK